MTPTMISTPIGFSSAPIPRSSKNTVSACITPPLRLMSLAGTTMAMARLPRIDSVATTTEANVTATG